jgi:hypothetical protein
MLLVTDKIGLDELQNMAVKTFGNLVKAVVDVEKKIMVVDAELHADQEKYLLEQGSNQNNLWGINIYPQKTGGDHIEFDSMINIRPELNNYSRSVEDLKLRDKIMSIVNSLIKH